MLPISFLAFIFLVFVTNAHAGQERISRSKMRLARQNDAFNGPETVQSVVQTTNAAGMPVTQTCTITMTPVVGPNGENLVQEDEDCRISINSDPNDPDVLTTATTTVSATSTSDVNNAPTTASVGAEGGGLGAVPVGTSVVAGSSAATTTAASASNTASAAVVVIGGGSVKGSQTASVSPPTGSQPANVVGPGSVPASVATASQSAASATGSTTSNSAAIASVPGKELSVLPIGLGVFGGVSAIALIVVGLVTYERTKYRKAFRRRRLQEAGQPMGYGGMGGQMAEARV